MPQEVLCKIFDNLIEHPVHFTRVAQVCRSWQLAADTHLYWKFIVHKVGLIPPKPKATIYKTYKSVVARDWGKFCSLCFKRSRAGENSQIRLASIQSEYVKKIYREIKTNWYQIFDKGDYSAFTFFKTGADRKDSLGCSSLKEPDLTLRSSTSPKNLDVTPPYTNSGSPCDAEILPSAVKMHMICYNCKLKLFSGNLSSFERRQLMCLMLKEHNITRGIDLITISRFCPNYINHGRGDPFKLVRNIVNLQWLYKNTEYKSTRIFKPTDAFGNTGPEYIDHEEGKRLALERWIAKRFEAGITTSPRNEIDSKQRPPSYLWQQIEDIIATR
ncbi:9562_t:CDS:1 [Acaulospora colombiana]|uniref:9562_t:CDS:1 n=1 Tax=Acaulospora colombiana TaxID=27376 RepID=A0ACA9LME5_9GLOM|nr:9562_t:CDS:1 [Acaulospora colombiana]